MASCIMAIQGVVIFVWTGQPFGGPFMTAVMHVWRLTRVRDNIAVYTRDNFADYSITVAIHGPLPRNRASVLTKSSHSC